MIHIGIDPGVRTGYAAWRDDDQRLISCTSMAIHEAMAEVLRIRDLGVLHSVTFEDARLRTWFGQAGREQLQGAGSIKRDCTIWADFLGAHGIAYRGIKPQPGCTKWTAEQFRRLTGWAQRTNEHARDAALLVVAR